MENNGMEKIGLVTPTPEGLQKINNSFLANVEHLNQAEPG